MTKIDIYSGFLGAGKTTLIKKMIKEAYHGQKLVLIENEFGEIGIDGGFLQEAGINITEMNSGCICCSLVGDFGRALKKVISEYHPDRILIEPSGVGKLSDVIGAVRKVTTDDVTLGNFVTVADATKCKMYMKNFGEFYNNQIETANTIILSRTQNVDEKKLDECVKLLRDHNPNAVLVTTPWDQLTGEQLMEAMEQKTSIAMELEELEKEAHEHHHHDHDEDDEHEHHHHHHGHDADEVFVSWGVETHKKFTTEQIEGILKQLEDAAQYGMVLRAKGYVASNDSDRWIHFDYVPGESDIREGGAMVTGRVCVIGSKLNESAIASLFGA